MYRPRLKPVGPGSLLDPHYISPNPDEVWAQFASKPTGFLTILTIDYNYGQKTRCNLAIKQGLIADLKSPTSLKPNYRKPEPKIKSVPVLALGKALLKSSSRTRAGSKNKNTI